MTPALNSTWSTTTPGLAMPAHGSQPARVDRRSRDAVLRERVGEFVGNVFYGTLMKQMRSSTLKGKYFHGGRGEEVFNGQLNMELAKRMGQNVADPVAKQMYESIKRFAEKQNAKPLPRPAGESGIPFVAPKPFEMNDGNAVARGFALEARRAFDLTKDVKRP